MSRKKKTFFEDSAMLNNHTYLQYIEHLTELTISMFEYKNLPDSVDWRFLELALFEKGQALWFKDEVMGDIVTWFASNGPFNIYKVPINRHAYAVNGYQNDLDDKNSVIIYNNMIRTNSILDVKMYARRLYNLDRAIDINCNAQKTPALIVCDQEQRLTMLNLYKEFDGNAPVIFGDKSIDLSALKVLRTDAPMVADKLFELKNMTWNEALTRIGISNSSYQKKERLVSDEVARSQGGTIASRYSRLEMRRQAIDQINKMFNHDIEVNYREDYREIDYDKMITGESEGKEDTPVKQLFYRAEGDY
jgi:hypothetical protein